MWYKYRHDACGGTSLWKETEMETAYYACADFPWKLKCGVCGEIVNITQSEDIQPVNELSEAVYDVRYPDPPTRDD